jgi:pyruvate,water dikinase
MTYTLSFSKIGREDVRIVGGKAASLGEMYHANFPVPPGFAITAEAFSDLRNKDLPKSFNDELMKQFDVLQADRVSVRSSALAEDSADASWAGQMETYLNVTRDQLINRIRDCWGSVNSKRVQVYAAKNHANPNDLVVGVVVQKMIDSDSAGVMFTVNPVDGNHSELMIEAGYGLGEGVVGGAITPDNYILARPKMEIISRTISDQLKMFAYKDNRTTTVSVSQEKRDKQKLTDSDIKKLAKMGVQIEEHYGSPQDIEWAFMNEELFILQSRPITTLNKDRYESQVVHVEPVTSGIGASQGVVTGKVRVITKLDDLKNVREGEILASHITTPDYVEIFPKLAGIITESGGATNHAAVVSREMGIPAVVGTKDITMRVKTGDVVTLDGATGYVYLGKVELSDDTSGKDFVVPTPTNDEIQDLINAITTVVNNPN